MSERTQIPEVTSPLELGALPHKNPEQYQIPENENSGGAIAQAAYAAYNSLPPDALVANKPEMLNSTAELMWVGDNLEAFRGAAALGQVANIGRLRSERMKSDYGLAT
jgi:hypothetical protein